VEVRKPTLRIVEHRHSATAKYVIEGARVNGKRRRYFFATKNEAEQELARLKIKQRREGENALHVSDSLRIMALECSEDLKPFDATLRDATNFYVKYLQESQKSVSVSTLAVEYLASVEKLKRSRTHQDDLRQRLGRFIEDFGECGRVCWVKNRRDSSAGLGGYRSKAGLNQRRGE
jgi:hypothetical protein